MTVTGLTGAYLMKILWITNIIMSEFNEYLFGKRRNDLWMGAMLGQLRNGSDEYIVVTSGKTRKTKTYVSGNIKYLLIPGGVPARYKAEKQDVAVWTQLLATEKPDVIHIWGTEFKPGLAALIAAEGSIPSIIYIQGILDAIARYYEAGMTRREILKNVTFRDIIKRDNIIQQKKSLERRAAGEREMLLRCHAVISENIWCDSHIKALASEVRIFRMPLPLGKAFRAGTWRQEQTEPYSLICNATGFTYKGLHIIMRAVKILKQKYPQIKLYIPGEFHHSKASLQWKLRRSGYTKFIEGLAEELEIAGNLVWLGYTDQQTLADTMRTKQVFILGSSVENHSSSLKEAMLLGMPCVASDVGGIAAYLRHGENGMLYRVEDYELLAEYVCKYFEDEEFCRRISERATADIARLSGASEAVSPVLDIYKTLISESRQGRGNA